ncbi:hypothetical protein GDO81_030157 [Engystomops pustulosus]|uniref:Secreted protein n=1 Tax=Engystomops pustulosus TaxID=76066 RepID=A0AAV6YHZ1_ENGPU|nr:hypothetical protein GDO81_030157 [Engystomops pustulosus]
MCNNDGAVTSAAGWAWLLVAPPTLTRPKRNSIRLGRGCVQVLHCSGSHTYNSSSISSQPLCKSGAATAVLLCPAVLTRPK